MNKAVLISIQPKWCELIANGKKTIEVRKTAPKIPTPFKCYIYCTRDAKKHYYIDEYGDRQVELIPQKVIGEFVCRGIMRPNDSLKLMAKQSCLSEEELHKYSGGKTLYGLRIADLKIYDKPKELSEFKTPPCEKPESACDNCPHKVNVGTYWEHEWDCSIENGKLITRPPMSWCYVEELSE